jgi:protoheme IX farnesyltransferase
MANIIMKKDKFAKYAWAVLAYNVLVIIWGAFVRASGSGAGCGNHWPDCNGSAIPNFQRFETVIEFTHRLTSGLVLPLVLVLLFWAYRVSPKKSPVRTFAFLSVLFTLTEALVGAGLVKFGLVENNNSAARAVVMSFHLVNTFILLATLTLTAWCSEATKLPAIRSQKSLAYGLILTLLSVLFLGVSGAVTALGDTLYPVNSIVEGLKQDFSPTAHFLIRLRLWHPFIAISVGLFLVVMFGYAAYVRPSEIVRKMERTCIFLFACELVLGLVNFLTRAPIEIQLIHLLVADSLWIAMVILIATVLSEDKKRVSVHVTELEPQEAPSQVELSLKTVVMQYISLTKPRVISLLLFTTLVSMIIAAKGWPGFWLFISVAIGGYMSAGAANAINMVIDRDIDGRMSRTASRPTVTQNITSQNALIFAFVLCVASFAILTLAANLLCAMLALSGLAFYVIVYTILLKRRTWHNIVIGGAAGAFPPLVGYAAVSNELTLLSWYLFAIIFVWTPVHFWALALVLKDEYKKAKIPMLPVVYGEKVTVIQIALYAVLTAIITTLPFVQHQLGVVYLYPTLVINAGLLALSVKLYQHPDHARARGLFKYSMVYLALLFIFIALDRTQGV